MLPDDRNWCLWKWCHTLFTALLQSSRYSFYHSILTFHSPYNVQAAGNVEGQASSFLGSPNSYRSVAEWMSLLDSVCFGSPTLQAHLLFCAPAWVYLVICLTWSYLDRLEGRANRNLLKVSKDKWPVLHPEKKICFAVTQVSDWLTGRGEALLRWPGASRVPWLHRGPAACWSAPRGAQPQRLSSSAWDLLGPILSAVSNFRPVVQERHW